MTGEGTLRGAGDDWLRWDGVETLPVGFFDAVGVGVAMLEVLPAAVAEEEV